MELEEEVQPEQDEQEDKDDGDDDVDAAEKNESADAVKVQFEETDVSLIGEPEEEVEEEPMFRVEILPIWSPINARAQAAMIYLYFRNVSKYDLVFYYLNDSCTI